MRSRTTHVTRAPLAALSALCASAVGAALAPADEEAVAAAEARVEANEHLDAINIVEAAIDAIERRSNRYHADLVRPLVVLGDALAGVGDADGATGAYDRALHVSRVNHGLHHAEQVEVVYRQAKLLASRGQYAQANGRHEYAYGVLLRSHGGENPALLPGLFVLADWYMTRYNIFSARSLYEHAAAVAERNLAADHPAHLRALRSVAATYRNERFPPFYTRRERRSGATGSFVGFQYRAANSSVNSFAKGERALIKVINILQARKDSENGENGEGGENGGELAAAMLDLGDWFLLFEKQGRALALYRHAWQLLEDRPAALEQAFGAPKPLYLPMPRDPAKPDGALASEGRSGVVELSIDIDEQGLVRGIDTIRSEPADLMDFRVRRAVKRARYRPPFDGQDAQPANGVRIEHTFVYYPNAQAAAQDGSRRTTASIDQRS